METVKYDKKSWHYLYARRGGIEIGTRGNGYYNDNNEWIVTTDTCTYTSYVLLGLFATTIAYAVAGFIISACIDLMMAIWFWQFPNQHGTFVIGVSILGMIVVVLYYLHKLWTAKPDGFITHTWDSLNNKLCKRVEIRGS